MINKKHGLVLALSFFVSGPIFYTTDRVVAKDQNVKNVVSQTPTTTVQAQGPERPDGSRDTETHRWSPGDGCSRLDRNAPDKKRDGTKPNTVSCTCKRKCVNGQTEEDLTKDKDGVYICRNASHKDRCSCPDPCKT